MVSYDFVRNKWLRDFEAELSSVIDGYDFDDPNVDPYGIALHCAELNIPNDRHEMVQMYLRNQAEVDGSHVYEAIQASYESGEENLLNVVRLALMIWLEDIALTQIDHKEV